MEHDPTVLDTSFICEDSLHTQYECMECNLALSECHCIDNPDEMGGDIYCHECAKAFWVGYDSLIPDRDDPEMIDADMDDDEFEAWVDKLTEEYSNGKTYPLLDDKWETYEKCRHYNQKVTLPGGTDIYASSEHRREDGDPVPDLGIYLSSAWTPAGPAMYIDWRDYGLPKVWRAAVLTLLEAHRRAKEGYWVEIGCVGGHGRTGTALACLAILDSKGEMTGTEAVNWVKDNYCEEAVECEEQAWWVTWFKAAVYGGQAESLPQWDKETKKYIMVPQPHQYDGIGDDFNFWTFQTPPPTDGGKIIEKFERKVKSGKGAAWSGWDDEPF